VSEPTLKERIAGERARLDGKIRDLRGLVGGLELGLRLPGPPGVDPGLSIAITAASIVVSLARLDTLMRLEKDESS
jgi:hypothetical protein